MSSVPPVTVSPGAGRRSVNATISILIEPTTRIRGAATGMRSPLAKCRTQPPCHCLPPLGGGPPRQTRVGTSGEPSLEITLTYELHAERFEIDKLPVGLTGPQSLQALV